MTVPDIKYDDRNVNSLRPSWSQNPFYLNEEHREIYAKTEGIPGWQMEGDTYKLFEMGYFAGDIILEIGTYGGRSAVVELRGALSNHQRTSPPQFFGIDLEINSVRRTYQTLEAESISEYALLFCGSLEVFRREYSFNPTMVFVDGDHRYEGVKRDLESLAGILPEGIPVLCHDYLNPENDTGEYGIRQAATEWEKAGYGEFIGVFGCAALFLATAKCTGREGSRLTQEVFEQNRVKLLRKYGITPKHSFTLSCQPLNSNPHSRQSSNHSSLDEHKHGLFLEWLQGTPRRDGFYQVSESRTFAFNESEYDLQYKTIPNDLRSGKGLVNLLKRTGGGFNSPGLELGCGTGMLSLGLVHEQAYPAVVLTDPSTKFLEITRRKLLDAKLDIANVFSAVLNGQDVGRLPKRSLSLIALRSTLHHILDVERFIHEAAEVLDDFGVLAFQEPCTEGYVLMGAMAQFLPLVLEKMGKKVSEQHSQQIRLFVDTMSFYARRDIDKSKAEDKHLFRVDEVMTICISAGLKVEFLPNLTFERFSESTEPEALVPDGFHVFFRDYLRYCMSFDEELVKLFDGHFSRYCQFIETLSGGGGGPYMHGVFLCRKN